MRTELEIRIEYQGYHDELSNRYYAGQSGLSKANFDIQHGQVWNAMKAELVTNGHYTELVIRDLEAELDKVKADIVKLKAK